MYRKMCERIIITVVIIVAVTLFAIMVMHGDKMGSAYSKFIALVIGAFDVMIPVLAVGALIKYLVCGNRGGCHCGHSHDRCCDNKKVDN